jgi:hypothetical protein
MMAAIRTGVSGPFAALGGGLGTAMGLAAAAGLGLAAPADGLALAAAAEGLAPAAAAGLALGLATLALGAAAGFAGALVGGDAGAVVAAGVGAAGLHATSNTVHSARRRRTFTT